ncbi:MAG: penicillin-binding protein 1C [Elusimicrobiota bacterium]
MRKPWPLLCLLLLSAPVHAARLTDRHGEPLRRLAAEESSVALEEMSPSVILATLAAEDRRFFRHSGVDARAAVRAVLSNLSSGRRVSGASTITMQVASPAGGGSRSLSGKFLQVIQALLLERRSSKQDILERYLNTIEYGNRCKGIEAAARLYFDKPAARLSLAESAFLAGLPQAPDRLDPYRFLERSRRRQAHILEKLYRWGWVSKEDYLNALRERLGLVPREKAFEAPHFTRIAASLSSADESRSHERRTTLDLRLQHDVEGILRSHLRRLKAQHVTSGAVLILDNPTGEVLAWVGSPDFTDEKNAGQVDGVLSLRQPGSALKPFLYGLALSEGMTPAELLADIPTYEADGFRPRNYDKSYHGPVRLREALACSYNVPAVRTARVLGPGKFLGLLREAGFSSMDKDAGHYGTGLALGNAEVTLLELANAYAGLARGGIWMREKLFVDSAAQPPSPAGAVGQRPPGTAAPEPPRRFLSREAAYLITHILSDNDARAEAFGLDSPLHVPFALAAKTGTSKDYRDNWAAGYTPDWTATVWVGNPDNSPMRNISGITGAAPILRDVALTLWRRSEPRPFPRPSSIVEADICPLSGKTPGLWCPTRVTEVFAKGRLPAGSCDMHRFSDGKVVVVLPEEFRPWMRDLSPTPADNGPYAGLSIAFPRPGDIFKIDPSFPIRAQKIRVAAALPGGAEEVRWSVDGRPPDDLEGDHFWLGLSPGRHRIELSVKTAERTLRAKPVSILVVR